MLIVDEVHYAKNKNGSWHKALAMISMVSKYSLLLSGTPLPRFAGEGNYLINII